MLDEVGVAVGTGDAELASVVGGDCVSVGDVCEAGAVMGSVPECVSDVDVVDGDDCDVGCDCEYCDDD